LASLHKKKKYRAKISWPNLLSPSLERFMFYSDGSLAATVLLLQFAPLPDFGGSTCFLCHIQHGRQRRVNDDALSALRATTAVSAATATCSRTTSSCSTQCLSPGNCSDSLAASLAAENSGSGGGGKEVRIDIDPPPQRTSGRQQQQRRRSRGLRRPERRDRRGKRRSAASQASMDEAIR
jgi:hypothetical protein